MTTDNPAKDGIIAKIIEWSINNKILVIILTAALIFGGIWAIQNTPVDAIPDLSDVQVIIFTKYPGQGPQIVEDQVDGPAASRIDAL